MSCKISKDYYDKLNMKDRLIKGLVYLTTFSFMALLVASGVILILVIKAMIG